MRQWWIDELGFAGAEHLDDDYVAGYDAKAQFDPTDDLAALARHGVGSGSRIVDLGAGTGTFAVAAARAGADVVAVDISPAMVDAIRRRDEGVAVVRAGFLSYEHEGPSADAVFTRNALHQLPDLWKVVALRRVAAMLRPGGILRLRDLCFDLAPGELDGRIDEWLQGAASDPTRGYTVDDLATHLREEFSTFTWLLEPMVERVGFEVLERDHRRSIFAAYTCRRI